MYKTIVLAYDGPEPGQKALLDCQEIGQWSHPRLHLVAVMPPLAPPMAVEVWSFSPEEEEAERLSYQSVLDSGVAGLRMLRTPLTLTNMGHPNPPDVGILTGSSATAYVTVTGGSVSAETMLRVQVIQDLPHNRLHFSLLDMTEGGQVADEVPVTQNGDFTPPGFSGSPVSTLEIRVNNYAALWGMIRNNYSGRLADVLKVETA